MSAPPAGEPAPGLARLALRQARQILCRRTARGAAWRAHLPGKARRALIAAFAPAVGRARAARRQGECRRCGACCRMMFECGFLAFDERGLSLCLIYDRRPEGCRHFPADERDLADRDRDRPKLPCGFSFPPRKARPGKTTGQA